MSSLEQVSQQSVAVSRDRSRADLRPDDGPRRAHVRRRRVRRLPRSRHHPRLGIVAFIGAIACIVGLNAALQRSEQLAIGLLFGMGAFLGVAPRPMLAYYASVEPQALWQAAGTTALFIGGIRCVRLRDSPRPLEDRPVAFFALLGLIVFGIVLMFVSIPGGSVIYAVLGLVIFAGYTMYDFQRLRHAGQIEAAPLLAASIFLDIFNVFMLMLSLFGGGRG